MLVTLLSLAILSLSMPAMGKPLNEGRDTTALSGTITDLTPPSFKDLRLSDKDAAIYRKLFAAQRRGDMKMVSTLQKQVSDPSLLPWLKVRTTAQTSVWLPPEPSARIYTSPLIRTAAQEEAAHNIALSVALLLKTDEIARAQGVIQRAQDTGVVDRIEGAKMTAQAAAALLYNNQPDEALRSAHLALQIGGLKTPEAAWTAGLASWMKKDYARAAQYFAWAPRSPYADPWLRSASAYWCARTLMRMGNYQMVSAWLREASQQPRSFYGLIATRTLGARFHFNWNGASFTDADRAALDKYPGAVRALKLAQAGQMDMARIELAMLDEKDKRTWRNALSALAANALKPDAAIHVAGLLNNPSFESMDTALYPLAPWEPEDGYRLDPALIHAFIRQESRFKPGAINTASGATGLLQLMPRTATSLDRSARKDRLKNPETSITLGQKYLEDLLDKSSGNLFEAAIAYNAGPGNLAKWKNRFSDVDDALLFIELIPYKETRNYVERVMANYWIYSLRMGEGASSGVESLDNIAGGKAPLYAHANNRDSTQIVLSSQDDANASSR